VVGVAVAAVLLGFVCMITPQGEPTCDGRRVTHWMAALGSSDQDREAHAFAAIQALSTNSLPIVIPWLGSRDTLLQSRFLPLVERVPFLRFLFSGPSERRQKAKIALVLAGEESMRASVPDLVRLSRDRDPGVRLAAVEALSAFPFNDTAPLPALRAAQADPDSRVRSTAQQAVGARRAVEQEVERLRGFMAQTNGLSR
jgi:HEAT repeat protein